MFKVKEEQNSSGKHKSKGFQLAGQEENLECRLKEILYGLKQAPRQWYLKFDSFMQRARVLIFVEDSWNEEPCIDVHQVGDEREVQVLCNFNWPPRELITEDSVLPERAVIPSLRMLVQDTLYQKSPRPVFG
ncbi:hypothetical protein Tco_0633996 [Tanacetum coccineum]